jgi:hypothetical protein
MKVRIKPGSLVVFEDFSTKSGYSHRTWNEGVSGFLGHRNGFSYGWVAGAVSFKWPKEKPRLILKEPLTVEITR